MTLTAQQVRGKLTDEQLTELGFDANDRPLEAEMNLSLIQKALEAFISSEPRYNKAEHWDELKAFFGRNRLNPEVTSNYVRAFNLVLNMGIVQPHVPEPEQPAQPAVNLAIEPDPELQRQQRLRDYEEKPVARFEGRDYTQRELDAMDSETYARVVRLKRFTGWLPQARNL